MASDAKIGERTGSGAVYFRSPASRIRSFSRGRCGSRRRHSSIVRFVERGHLKVGTDFWSPLSLGSPQYDAHLPKSLKG